MIRPLLEMLPGQHSGAPFNHLNSMKEKQQAACQQEGTCNIGDSPDNASSLGCWALPCRGLTEAEATAK